MKIETKDLIYADSKYLGADLYIVEVSFKTERPRIIEPTKAKLTARDNVNYSHNVFVPYSSSGKLLKKDIKIYDNTGYRSYSGNPISVFDNEVEAKEWFNTELSKVIENRIKQRDIMISDYDKVTEKYKKMLS